VAAPKGQGTRIRIEVRKRNAFRKKEEKNLSHPLSSKETRTKGTVLSPRSFVIQTQSWM
jgi:hypothetical protein